jgi:hypothetical protein
LSSPLIDRILHLVYIDDLCLFGPCRLTVDRLLASVILVYRKAGLIVNDSKTINATSEPVEIIGMSMCGKTQTLQCAVHKRFELLSATLLLIMQGRCTGNALSRLLGHFTWSLLLCRPALSVLRHSYRFIAISGRRTFDLWPSVVRELLLLCSLLPLLVMDLSAPFCSRVPATDASEHGGGVMCTRMTQQLFDALWPFVTASNGEFSTLTSNAHTYIDTPLHALAQPCLAMLDSSSCACVPFCADSLFASASFLFGLVPSLSWSLIAQYSWRWSGSHINTLEMEALNTAVRWLCSMPSCLGTRVISLVDSQVVFYIVRKGRTSSPACIRATQRLAATLLATGIQLFPVWIPSKTNPADAPSRAFS